MSRVVNVKIKSSTVTTVPQFLETINALPERQYLFRGQGQDYDLSPSVARVKHRETDIEVCERKMLTDLKRRAGTWFKGSLLHPSSELDWLAMAQHHDMATRLLDWSENPLVALWFAVEKKFEPKEHPIGGNCPVVWAFQLKSGDLVDADNEENIDPFAITKTRVFRPTHISPRIIAQDGWFTLHAYRRNAEGAKSGFIPLQKNTTTSGRLTKVGIDVNCVGALREELRRYGLHPASIYPSLEGLCRDINQRNTKRGDEESPRRSVLDDTPKKKLVLGLKRPETTPIDDSGD